MQKRTTWVNSVILTFSQQNEKTLATIQNEFREKFEFNVPTHTYRILFKFCESRDPE